MRRWQIAALLALALLAGCAGVARQKTEFYLLEALADPAPISKLQGDAWLGLGPVTLARYLDRPQMVTRVGGNRLVIDALNHSLAGRGEPVVYLSGPDGCGHQRPCRCRRDDPRACRRLPLYR